MLFYIVIGQSDISFCTEFSAPPSQKIIGKILFHNNLQLLMGSSVFKISAHSNLETIPNCRAFNYLFASYGKTSKKSSETSDIWCHNLWKSRRSERNRENSQGSWNKPKRDKT